MRYIEKDGNLGKDNLLKTFSSIYIHISENINKHAKICLNKQTRLLGIYLNLQVFGHKVQDKFKC